MLKTYHFKELLSEVTKQQQENGFVQNETTALSGQIDCWEQGMVSCFTIFLSQLQKQFDSQTNNEEKKILSILVQSMLSAPQNGANSRGALRGPSNPIPTQPTL